MFGSKRERSDIPPMLMVLVAVGYFGMFASNVAVGYDSAIKTAQATNAWDAPAITTAAPPKPLVPAGPPTPAVVDPVAVSAAKENKAMHAWSNGDYALAAKLYGELAREQPDMPGFATVANICARKAARARHPSL